MPKSRVVKRARPPKQSSGRADSGLSSVLLPGFAFVLLMLALLYSNSTLVQAQSKGLYSRGQALYQRFYSTTQGAGNMSDPEIAEITKAEEGYANKDGIQLPQDRQVLLDFARELFGSKFDYAKLRKHWSENAIFEDPIAKAEGLREYAAQWAAMPKAFPVSESLAWKVIQNEGNRVVWVQKHRYTVRGIGFKKIMISRVEMDLDSNGKVVHFKDLWDGKPLPTNAVAMFFRKLNARTVPYMVGVPGKAEYEQQKTA